MNKKIVAYEMARRKIQFHKEINWNKIMLWGLFKWSDISYLLKRGDLITDMKKENVTIWVRPSKTFWENDIKPLIKKHSLDELTRFAGW